MHTFSVTTDIIWVVSQTGQQVPKSHEPSGLRRWGGGSRGKVSCVSLSVTTSSECGRVGPPCIEQREAESLDMSQC